MDLVGEVATATDPTKAAMKKGEGDSAVPTGQEPVPSLAGRVDVILKFVYKGIWWISTFCVPYLHHKKSTYVIESD